MATFDGDQRTVVDLLVDQIEFADVILVNKVDLVSDEQRLLVKNLIHRLNPDAKIIETTKSSVPVSARHAAVWSQMSCSASRWQRAVCGFGCSFPTMRWSLSFVVCS